MNKLDNALNALGLNMDFFNELKSEVATEKLVTENGLLPATEEDVQDEFEQLETSLDEDAVDEDDESQIEMDTISPAMRGAFS